MERNTKGIDSDDDVLRVVSETTEFLCQKGWLKEEDVNYCHIFFGNDGKENSLMLSGAFFVEKNLIYIRKGYSKDESALIHTIAHETIHSQSFRYYNEEGSVSCSGLSTIKGGIELFQAINEGITEKLTLEYLGKKLEKDNYYYAEVSLVNALIERGVFTEKEICGAYFSGDKTILVRIEIFFEKGSLKKLSSLRTPPVDINQFVSKEELEVFFKTRMEDFLFFF